MKVVHVNYSPLNFKLFWYFSYFSRFQFYFCLQKGIQVVIIKIIRMNLSKLKLFLQKSIADEERERNTVKMILKVSIQTNDPNVELTEPSSL